MKLPSVAASKNKITSPNRFASARDAHRIGHGGTAWASASSGDVNLYQPQDGAVDPRSRVADIASRMRKMAGEPDDARLTGGTRSLMRRLSGLNVGMNAVRRVKPVSARSLPLAGANVA